MPPPLPQAASSSASCWPSRAARRLSLECSPSTRLPTPRSLMPAHGCCGQWRRRRNCSHSTSRRCSPSSRESHATGTPSRTPSARSGACSYATRATSRRAVRARSPAAHCSSPSFLRWAARTMLIPSTRTRIMGASACCSTMAWGARSGCSSSRFRRSPPPAAWSASTASSTASAASTTTATRSSHSWGWERKRAPPRGPTLSSLSPSRASPATFCVHRPSRYL